MKTKYEGWNSANTSETVEHSGYDMQHGCWTVAENSAVELPEVVQKAFDKAGETLTGSYNEVTPIAHIGR